MSDPLQANERPTKSAPLLLGDIGGTKTLLALVDPADASRILLQRSFPSRDHASLEAVLERFLAEAASAVSPGRRLRAAFGVAGPCKGRRVKVTHLPWEIDADALQERFGFDRVELANDFAIAARGIPRLDVDHTVVLQHGEPDPSGVRLAVGAGTGLGVALLVPRGDRWQVIAGEGGHIGFAPFDERTGELWSALRRRHGRVGVEHVVSGMGIENIYRFLRDRPASDALPPDADAATISAYAADNTGSVAAEALEIFVASYGAAAGDMALFALATGGVYIAGGIAPKLIHRLQRGGFMTAFKDKGAHSALMSGFPVHVVTTPYLALLGAAALLQD